jgi:hypothetical protein
MIEQQRALDRPRRRRMRCKDDRREHLHPIADEVTMVGLPQLTGLGVDAKAPVRSLETSDPRMQVRRAHRVQRLGDPTRDKLMARRLRTPSPLTRRSPCSHESCQDSSRDTLTAHVRLAPTARRVLVALATMTRLVVGAVETDPRARVLGPRHFTFAALTSGSGRDRQLNRTD